MTNSERELIRAVGRLYRSNPGVVRFQMKRRPGGVVSYGDDCYRWYRQEWMTPILNAYRTMLRAKRRSEKGQIPMDECVGCGHAYHVPIGYDDNGECHRCTMTRFQAVLERIAAAPTVKVHMSEHSMRALAREALKPQSLQGIAR